MPAKSIESLRKLGPLITREQAWLSFNEETETSLEKEKLNLALQILNHPEFTALIDEGHITLAAVKPNVHLTSKVREKLQVDSDPEGARKILGLIKSPLELVFQISINPTPEDLDKFYPDLVEQIGSEKYQGFIKQMMKGPITYCLLYCGCEDSVSVWRSQIGSTNPREAKPGTIRAEYAEDIRDNLVHGSSSIQEAKREISWLRDQLQKIKPLK